MYRTKYRASLYLENAPQTFTCCLQFLRCVITVCSFASLSLVDALWLRSIDHSKGSLRRCRSNAHKWLPLWVRSLWHGRGSHDRLPSPFKRHGNLSFHNKLWHSRRFRVYSVLVHGWRRSVIFLICCSDRQEQVNTSLSEQVDSKIESIGLTGTSSCHRNRREQLGLSKRSYPGRKVENVLLHPRIPSAMAHEKGQPVLFRINHENVSKLVTSLSTV